MNTSAKTILGFDPGKDKCGIAIRDECNRIVYHQVVNSETTISTLEILIEKHGVDLIVMGDRTTAKFWLGKLQSELTNSISVVTVDESNSTLEARDRYWIIYPPQGLKKLIPKGLRVPPRPVDDIVAILLIERYLAK